MDMSKWIGEKNPCGHNSTQSTAGKQGMLGVGEVVFIREEHTDWLSNTKWSILKTCIQVTLYRQNKLYLRIIYICNVINVCNNNEQKEA